MFVISLYQDPNKSYIYIYIYTHTCTHTHTIGPVGLLTIAATHLILGRRNGLLALEYSDNQNKEKKKVETVMNSIEFP